MSLMISLILSALVGLSASAQEATPVMFTDMLKGLDIKGARPWVAPDYSGQEKSLGYSPGAFAVPTGMEARVNFWIDIYSKYTTDQGLLHDSRYVHITYEPVDFTDIMKDETLTLAQKEKARKNRVDDAKAKIRERLKKLQTLSSPAGLDGEDLRYWYMFNTIDEQNKFIEAGKDGRLRFQLGQKDRFIQGIYQSGRFIREMEKIFRAEGLPIELVRMVYVESSFNLRARSKVGASGIWQFMRRTGREYLRIDTEVDERNDPLLATRAAARKLKGNFRMLQSWPLAVTGYNHGPFGVRKLVEKAGTRDIAELTDVRKGTFGFASASFYASFLAAIEVERNADKYFGTLTMAPALEGSELRLTKALDAKKLLSWFSGDHEKAKDFNPHVSASVWKGHRNLKRGDMIRVLPEKLAQVKKELGNHRAAAASARGETHTVSRGETLSHIADKYKVSLIRLMELNNISKANAVQVGQILYIPAQ